MLELLSRKIAYPLWDVKDGSERLLEYRRLLKSQWLPASELRRRQLSSVRTIVKYAYDHCPFYRHFWGELPKIDSLGDLTALPVVTKRAVREHLSDMIARGAAELIEAKTGGSTGTALRVFFDKRCQEFRNAAAMRSDGWAGWRPGMLVAALWGTPPVPRTIKERIRNAVHDRIFFLDTMNLDEQAMQEFAHALVRRRPGCLFGHAHSLFIFCSFLKKKNIAVPVPKGVIATSMMLLENERKLIEEVLKCRVTNRYGCEEVGLIASECERHEGLHVNAEHVYVEILDDENNPSSPGESGQIVVTDLVNRGMPLIRYALEDMGAWATTECGCGRSMPTIEKIVGRVADCFVRRDGSLVAGVSLVEKTLTAIAGIEQLQIVQVEMSRFEMNIVRSSEYGDVSERELDRVMRDVFGEKIELTFNYLSRIPQERNGKYRFAIRKTFEAADLVTT